MNKSTGGIRPIAIGELFFRTASRYINERTKRTAANVLAPHQFAVGESAGCERIIHSLRHHLTDTNNPSALLKIDLKNAFNSIDRAVVLLTLYNTPELTDVYRIANFAYGKPSSLLIAQTQHQAPQIIQSSTGVKQGDPLSTMLFCLALHHTYEKIVAETNCTVYAFVDDGNITGKPEELIKALTLLKQQLPSLHLDINSNKSSFTYFHNDIAPLAEDTTQTLAHHHIQIEQQCVSLLGAVIGCSVQIEHDHLQDVVAPINLFCNRLQTGRLSAQMAMLLLRSAGVFKMNYLIRCMSPDVMLLWSESFDNTVLDTAQSILCLGAAEMDRENRHIHDVLQLLQLPIRYGGWGLTPATMRTPIAYVASLALTASRRSSAAFRPYLTSVHSDPQQSSNTPTLPQNTRLHEELSHAIDMINSVLADDKQQLIHTPDTFLPYYHTHPLQCQSLQHKLTKLAHDNIFNAAQQVLRENVPEHKETLAHINSIVAPHAADWKTAIPTSSALAMNTEEYRVAARLNLGLDPYSYQTRDCHLCYPENNNRLATDKYHYLSCRALKSRELTDRHNAIVTILQRFFHYAGAMTRIEPASLTGASRIRPDLSVVIPGHHYLIDVRVTHPLCPSHVSAACAKPLGATFSAEQEKHKKYNQLAQGLKAEFVPFVVESLGGITLTSQILLDNIIRACSEHQSIWSAQELKDELYGAIAVAIQQGNARAMTAGHYWSISSTQVRQQQPSPAPSSVSSSATQNAHIHPERIANIAAASSIVSSVASSVSASSPPSKALVHPQRLANIRSSVSSAA